MRRKDEAVAQNRKPGNSGAGQPQLAVIMPCRNPSAGEIRWTLDSLRAQTVPFRLYLVDDASEPRPDYARLLRGIDRSLILLTESRGVCTVRNPAVERALADGFEFVAIIDCGDWCHPQRFRKQLDFMAANPDIHVLGTASNSLNPQHRLVYSLYPPLRHDRIARNAFYGLPFRHPSMMFRAELFRQVGLYSGEFDAAEDYELVRRALGRFRMANLPDVLVDKVLSPNSISATRRRSQLWSRLRIQWRYRDPGNPHCCFGLLRTLAVLMTPTPLVERLQRWVYRPRSPDAPASVARFTRLQP